MKATWIEHSLVQWAICGLFLQSTIHHWLSFLIYLSLSSSSTLEIINQRSLNNEAKERNTPCYAMEFHNHSLAHIIIGYIRHTQQKLQFPLNMIINTPQQYNNSFCLSFLLHYMIYHIMMSHPSVSLSFIVLIRIYCQQYNIHFHY